VRIGKIERAVAQQDFQTLEEAAHGLKSGAANLGAKEMARLCEELETRGETRSLGEAAELLAKLRDSWTDVRSQVIAYH
jgi:HPt (histidine-containing phosphotransfer) domain-containing protein